ncbi:hypothetical protein SAMN06297129_2365 [Pseudooceanicola antarcticus]|uniref:Class I SAM-dependent methyltransferase n=1 Tax=Pseudooceanicola antarcticus TaxID=1247613 RepID=A0A285J0G5_9RHOB|nr:hypothetical protein [Pseudooceanicola antarcticus]PJE25840.1 hypothetical protein CVM39_19250 [Pseudooceanicola antarcticus]SNY52651.1 hypothetical protein SAMN06297129_2365 [Pseudooceanicola antarcticus]
MTRAAHLSAPERPELTFPEAEGQAVALAYSRAKAILEYGSGGSTVMAAEMGKTVTSVESDGNWARMMRAYFEANPPRGQVEVIHAEVGPTREWGHPVDDRDWRRFAAYPLGIWQEGRLATQPDVVLVDGRFRTGCVLATAFNITQPVTLLLDDYRKREQYHEIEDFVGQPTLIGRLAVFEINPMPVPSDRLLDVIRMMTHA